MQPAQQDHRPIMMLDGLNVFMAHYAANPSVSLNGNNVGGIVGLVRALQSLVNVFQPKRVIVVWESGGSPSRVALYSMYKSDRKRVRLNRHYGDRTPDDDRSKLEQLRLLVNVLKQLPVCQLYVKDCEADDAIGHMCRSVYPQDRKIIVSSDRDFYQLIDDLTCVYRPIKRVLIDQRALLDEMGVPAHNVVLCRAICGDRSDSIPGIKGIGIRTLIKRFPTVVTDDVVSVDDIMRLCDEHCDCNVTSVYSNIAMSRDVIVRNMKLMLLDSSMITQQHIEQIVSTTRDFIPHFNNHGLITLLTMEGIQGIDVDSLSFALSSLQ